MLVHDPPQRSKEFVNEGMETISIRNNGSDISQKLAALQLPKFWQFKCMRNRIKSGFTRTRSESGRWRKKTEGRFERNELVPRTKEGRKEEQDQAERYIRIRGLL